MMPPPSASAQSATTPLMQQYLQLKARFPEEILFFRLGDFYEMFFDDAVKASSLLDVVLTKRQSVPMCGIPYHAAPSYMSRLLKAGLCVAVAEQMEDPKKTKGMVKRDVVRVVTPGTVLDEELLEPKTHNFLAAIVSEKNASSGGLHWALAVADVSTGRQWVGDSLDDDHATILRSQLSALNPSEILFVGQAQNLACFLSVKAVFRFEPHLHSSLSFSEQATQAVQSYLNRDRVGVAPSLSEPEPLPLQSSGIMFLDETAVQHLELVSTNDAAKEGPTLIRLLDRCKTPLGSRLLRWWLLHPLLKKDLINERLDRVESFIAEPSLRDRVRECLGEMCDIERINVRVQAKTASPRDLGALRSSLQLLPSLREMLSSLSGMNISCEVPQQLSDILFTHLTDEPPVKLDAGDVIKAGVHAELDELRQLRRSGKSWIAQMEAHERSATGIGSLKVGYNDVFGYFLEVSKSNLSKVPAAWIRKQTLVNAERFITPALKEQEEKILSAEDKIRELEKELFLALVDDVSRFSGTLKSLAQMIATLDVAAALAEVACDYNYTRPVLLDSDELVLKSARHPVIENQLERDRFIPNDVILGGEGPRLTLITGPNMAGKSTYLRQTALIVIMAQMGSYVPALEARIGLVDKIFTRIGASDRLAQGQSTFMVEMQEVASLLAHATRRSFLVLDEVGRGTSTYDGISIAWAVVDYLMKQAPRTLFATHYFELTQLAETLPGVANAHATAKEWTSADGKKQVIFLYQILPGPADRSYGIHVAEMAGLPQECIHRAREILKLLESGTHAADQMEKPAATQSQLDLFSAHPLIEELRQCHIDELTPLEGLNELARLKKMVQDR